MLELKWDEGFKRKYKKIIKNNNLLKDEFWEKIKIFYNNPFDGRLKTHKLSGKLKKLWSFRIDYDCRVIFEFLSEKVVLLIDVGGHDEVY